MFANCQFCQTTVFKDGAFIFGIAMLFLAWRCVIED